MVGSRRIEGLQGKSFRADTDEVWKLEQIELIQISINFSLRHKLL